VVTIVGPDWEPPAAAAPSSRHSGLNPKYTFQQFVIGEGNRFAHAAALAVAELPAQAYNPLFVHGRPGLGKTHLLHAIGNYVERYGSGLLVRYATVEDFTREFLDALRRRNTSEFKDSFRKADVVLIDDVQLLARKDATCDEFFHTFNALVQSGRQLVLTSDRGPADLLELDERLAGRFRSGLVVELRPPELAVRRAILAKRARLDAVDVPPSVLDEIAIQVHSSVRELEAALIQVVAHTSLHGLGPTPELVRDVLGRPEGAPRRGRCDLSDILDVTARAFHVSQADLVARDRRPAVALARQVAMYLARELTDQSLPAIGRAFGGRNHATVLHALRRVEESISRDTALYTTVDNLKELLCAPR
jgi:chromosomal replication initiator protein